MERLTERHNFELRGLDGKQYKASDVVLKSTGMPAGNDEIEAVYNKLAEFEDFMEEQGFESLEDLQKYIEQSFKVVKILSDKNIQINNLQYRWQKLKEWVQKQSKPIDDIVISDDETKYIYMSDIFDEMQELEKEIK